MSAIDKRISELQERLHRKRLLNQQLANQISAASHKAAYHQLVRYDIIIFYSIRCLYKSNETVRLTGSADQTNAGYLRKPQTNNTQPPNGLSRSNIAAVEPYNHVPLPSGHQRNNINGVQEVCFVLLTNFLQAIKYFVLEHISSSIFPESSYQK